MGGGKMGKAHRRDARGLYSMTADTKNAGSSIRWEIKHQSRQSIHRRSVSWWSHDGCHVSYGKERRRSLEVGLDGRAFYGSSVRHILP